MFHKAPPSRACWVFRQPPALINLEHSSAGRLLFRAASRGPSLVTRLPPPAVVLFPAEETVPMRRVIVPAVVAACVVGFGAACGQGPASEPPATRSADEQLIATARGIHERVIALDTHDDIDPANFTKERNYTQRLDNQVNLPKMIDGGLDASFFIVYVGQGPLTPEGYDQAYKQAIEKFDAIHRLTKELAPDQIELALTAADVRRIAASGKKVALIGVENAYPLGTDLSRVKEFYDRGGRYMSLAHNGHSQFADSNTGERDGKWVHDGLSEAGRNVIGEMNKWGIMVDVSHPSKQANLQAIALSKAPVIASHSAARSLADHSRNLDDEQLEAIRKNGGVVQTVAFDSYVKIKPPDSPERADAIAKLHTELGVQGSPRSLSETARAEFRKRMDEINKSFPPPPMATVSDFVDHIDYLVKKVGVDHVGISSDFDGGGGVDGWNGAEETFNVTLELVRRGYSEEQIGKIWSGNLLRVMDEVQKVAQGIQAGTN
jgi:membrane dipeptidase